MDRYTNALFADAAAAREAMVNPSPEAERRVKETWEEVKAAKASKDAESADAALLADANSYYSAGQLEEIATPTFIWTDERCRFSPKGTRKVLRSPSFPKGSLSPLCGDDRLAVCSYEGKRVWEARFWVGYESIKATAGTMAKAMRLLESELQRRSLGLFGADVIRFEGSAA